MMKMGLVCSDTSLEIGANRETCQLLGTYTVCVCWWDCGGDHGPPGDTRWFRFSYFKMTSDYYTSWEVEDSSIVK